MSSTNSLPLPAAGVCGRIFCQHNSFTQSYYSCSTAPQFDQHMRTATLQKRSRQLLLSKKHGLRSDRHYYMPANLADAMIRLLDGSSNEGLATLSQILRRGQHTLGQLWTSQLSPQDTEDLRAANAVLPGLRTQFEAAQPHVQRHSSTFVDAELLEGTTVNSTSHDPWYALPRPCSMPRPSYLWLVTSKQS